LRRLNPSELCREETNIRIRGGRIPRRVDEPNPSISSVSRPRNPEIWGARVEGGCWVSPRAWRGSFEVFGMNLAGWRTSLAQLERGVIDYADLTFETFYIQPLLGRYCGNYKLGSWAVLYLVVFGWEDVLLLRIGEYSIADCFSCRMEAQRHQTRPLMDCMEMTTHNLCIRGHKYVKGISKDAAPFRAFNQESHITSPNPSKQSCIPFFAFKLSSRSLDLNPSE
jgi:hypothetical protein